MSPKKYAILAQTVGSKQGPKENKITKAPSMRIGYLLVVWESWIASVWRYNCVTEPHLQAHKMTPLANLNGVSNTLPPITKLPDSHRNPKRRQFRILGLQGSQTRQLPPPCPVLITRRAAIGLVSFILAADSTNKPSLALDNGFWYEEPLPSPSVSNQIANEKTGTRSFLKKGIYMANIGVKGSVYRIKKYAFDLLAMADLVAEDTLNYVRRYLRLKSTFMYYDFDKVISAVSLNDKQPLTDMANKLFENFEKLEDAARRKNFPETKASYQETSVMLHEVMDRMSSLYKTI